MTTAGSSLPGLPSVRSQSVQPAVREKSHNVLRSLSDNMMLGALMLHIATLPYLRQFGAAGFLLFVGIAGIYVVFRPHPLMRDWRLLSYLLYGVVAIILSYMHIFPSAWTVLYDKSAIFRQSYFIFAFFLLLVAFTQMWAQLIRRRRLGLGIGLYFVFSMFAAILFAAQTIGGLANTVIPNLTTAGIGLFLGFCYFAISRRSRLSVVAAMGVVLLVIMIAGTMQTLIAGLMILLFIVSPWRRALTAAFAVTALLVPVAVQFLDLSEVRMNDVNTLIRIAFWQDAFTGVVESKMLGIGFGTEAVRNYYAALPNLSPYMDDEMMWQSVHNTFVLHFLRLGVLGGALFISMSAIRCFPGPAMPRNREVLACYAYFLAMFSMTVNVGEGPFFLVGVCAVLGLVVALSSLGPVRGRSPVGSRASKYRVVKSRISRQV